VKIDDSIKGLPAVRNRETRTTRSGSDPAMSQPPHTSDSVDITPTSARLSQLESDLARVDSSNAGKIEAIRQAIAEGSFQVNEEAVATALVNTTMDQLRLIGRGSR
jgi:negative regulator of flagellin synthesis FlgM